MLVLDLERISKGSKGLVGGFPAGVVGKLATEESRGGKSVWPQRWELLGRGPDFWKMLVAFGPGDGVT